MGKGVPLSEQLEQVLNISKMIYEHQDEMYRTKKHRVDHQIVSFDQPGVLHRAFQRSTGDPPQK
jgi:hypothetical protein